MKEILYNKDIAHYLLIKQPSTIAPTITFSIEYVQCQDM